MTPASPNRAKAKRRPAKVTTFRGFGIEFYTSMGRHLTCYEKRTDAEAMARTFGSCEPPIYRVVAKLTRVEP